MPASYFNESGSITWRLLQTYYRSVELRKVLNIFILGKSK